MMVAIETPSIKSLLLKDEGNSKLAVARYSEVR